MPSPVPIYLSNHQIIQSVNFARLTWSNHYHRMWHTKEKGISQITKGKLGEIALETFASMNGIKSQTNLQINTGIDRYDLEMMNYTISVKTKACVRSFPSDLSTFYLHIPCDQYSRIVRDKTDFLIAVFLRCKKSPSWQNLSSLSSYIVGGIRLKDYDTKKVLHKAGTYPKGWNNTYPFPPPDSFAVSWQDLVDINNIFREISIPF